MYIWCISGSRSPRLFFVELGAAIKVGSMIVPCFMAMPRVLERLPRHQRLHFGQKFLAFGLLFGGALLVITKTQLFAPHQASPSQRSELYSPKVWDGFPESP